MVNKDIYKTKEVFSFTIIFLFELIFYIFDFTSNMIICVLPNHFEVGSLIYLFINVAMFLLMIIICFNLTSTKVICKNILLFGCIILIGKCILDIMYAIIGADNLYNQFIGDIFHIILLALIFILFAAIWKLKPADIKISNNKLLLNIILLVSEILCLIIAGIMLVSFIDNVYYKYDVEKIMSVDGYQLNCTYYINGATELYGIISVFIRSLIFFTLINIFNFVYSPDTSKSMKSSLVVYGVVLLCFVLNICFNNANVFSGIKYQKSVVSKNSSDINTDYGIFCLFRGIGDDRHLYYTAEKNYVYFGEEYVCTFNTHPLSACGWFVDYGDYEQSSIICQNELIAYIDENNQWTVIKFKDLKDIEENETLSSVLKNVCSTGSLEAIEFSLPYFQKYEQDYINELNSIITETSITDNGNWLLNEEYSSEIVSDIIM